MSENSLSHIGADGRAHMVDVGAKTVTARKARAEGRLICAPETLAIVRNGKAPKGAVIATAEIAGIMAAKKTADLIPLCHPLSLSKVGIDIVMDEALPGFRLSAEVKTSGQTGVEMEALTAVSVAVLTLYDMLKAVDKTMRIDGIEVVAKAGGKADFGY
ncbi:cyclic pyranopterin monophosphate synthase MoaC [Asticcacaulis sp. AND118]|uniref:cyclic pyranopterin monophosphate synthase MoaC n=1 Tax=Asticcacaulis sp. AND118 TaxID=2840468 RepID=UPI001CFFBC6A|nr:cyclic pyranopterin monophosphate synthase MoaC [Asticcacaulis sp. AND118]UDF04287.1 cyclic pyranopterin monophosphate synthase MoaC [Asticcacaulis sp. AND118]